MLLPVPDLLTPGQVARARRILEEAEWVDGRVTAGHQSARAKDNMQLPENSPAAREVGDMVLTALAQNALFISAALPLRVFPPLFNRYSGGQSFGTHVDNAIRQIGSTGHRIRTDLSATLFLAAPDEYDGGELVVEDTCGTHEVKLPAGHLICIRPPLCTTSGRSREVRGWLLSSGSKAWCAKTRSERCSSTSISPSSGSTGRIRTTR